MRNTYITASFAILVVVAITSGCQDRPAGGGNATNTAPTGGKADGNVKRVILLTNGADPFWDAMRVGMQDAERDLKLSDAGLQVVMDQNDGTEKGQVDKLRKYATQSGVAAVAVSVTNAKSPAIASEMSNLRKQGIKVITVDSDVDRDNWRSSRFAYLGTDNVLGGQELGKAARGVRPAGGTYVTFVGLKSAANAQERISGFATGAGEKFASLNSMGDQMDKSIARKNVQDALNKFPEVNVLVGIWAYNAHAIVDVVTERKLRDKINIVVFDAAPLAVGHMEEGKIDAMVVQNPYKMGYEGVRLMKALVEDDQSTIQKMFPAWDSAKQEFKEPDGDIMITGLKVVSPDEGSHLKAEMFAPTTEFLKLSEFIKWLKDHKLTGS